MPVGGGGADDRYTAEFVIDTTAAEAAIKRLRGELNRLDGVMRNVSPGVRNATRQARVLTERALRDLSTEALPRPSRKKGEEEDPYRNLRASLYQLNKDFNTVAKAGGLGAAEIENFGKRIDRIYYKNQQLIQSNSALFSSFRKQRAAIAELAQWLKQVEQVGLELNMAEQVMEEAREMERAQQRALAAQRRYEAENERIARQMRRTLEEEQKARIEAEKRALAEQERIRAKQMQLARERQKQAERELAAALRIYEQMKRIQPDLEMPAALQGYVRKQQKRAPTYARLVDEIQQSIRAEAGAAAGGGKGGGVTGPYKPVASSAEPPRKGGVVPLHGKDRIRGQAMPERTQEQARALLRLSSAAQGVMVGMGLAQGSVMNLAFSFIFLSYGIVKLVALFAALTAAVVGLKKLFVDLPKAAQAVGQAFEASGQQMASFLRSAQMAWDVMEQGRIIAENYGVAVDDARQAVFELTKVNQAQAPVIQALLNASAATGRAFSDVARQYAEILRASNEQRSGLVRQFAKDMDITVRDYANTVELINAINERFAGAAEAQAQTTAGMIGRMRAYINSLMTDIGIIVNEAIKPVIGVFAGFFQGMSKGFRSAMEAAKANGKLNKDLQEVRAAASSLLPKMTELGYVIGRALFGAIMLVVRAIKIFLDVLRAAVNALKWIVDQIRSVAQVLKKEGIEPFLDSPPVVTGVVTTIIKALAHLIKYISDDFLKLLRSSVDDIAKGFKKIGSVFDDVFKGLGKITKGAADDVGKGLKPLATLFDDIVKGLGKGVSKAVTVVDDFFRALIKNPKGALDDVGKGFRGLVDNLISGADDLVRGVIPALKSVGSGIGSFADDLVRGIGRAMTSGSFDDIVRGFFSGLGNAFRSGASTATSLFDDIGRGISAAFRGAFTLASGVDDIARGLWGSLKTVFTVPKELFKGLVSGLKSGLILALLEVVTLKAVDQLPLSDQMKTSIGGVAQMAFLGAGLGSIFGPPGMAVGAALGAAIGLGLEAVKPGLAKEVMDKINGAIGGAMEGIITFTREKIIPWSQEFIQGFLGIGGEADTAAQKLGENFRNALEKVAEVLGRVLVAVGELIVKAGQLAADIGSHADDAWRKLQEILGAIGDYIETRFGPTWDRLSTFFVEELVPAMKETYGWFKENIWPILQGLAEFIVTEVMPVLGELALWFGEKILKALGILIDFGIKVALKWFNDFFDFFEAYGWPVLKFTIEQIGNLVEIIIDVGKAIYEKAEPYLKDIWDFLENKLGPVIDDVVEFGLKAMKRVLDEIANMPTPFGILKSALDGIKSVVETIWNTLQKIKDFDIGDVAKKIPGAGALSKLGKIDINPFSTGGIVRGPYPGDTVPAMLSPGEVILNAAQQRNLVGLMAALAASPGDAGGGGTLIINVSLPNSVVADESSMNALAGRVADAITARLGSGRKFTYHRV